jgi:hypothetical protein
LLLGILKEFPYDERYQHQRFCTLHGAARARKSSRLSLPTINNRMGKPW